MKITCLGDVGVDHYIVQNKKFLGGCSFNFAFAFTEVCRKTHVQFIGPQFPQLTQLPFFENSSMHFLGPSSRDAIPVQPISLEENGEKIFSPYLEGGWKNFVLPKSYWGEIFDQDIFMAVGFRQNFTFIEDFLFQSNEIKMRNTRAYFAIDFLNGKEFGDDPQFYLPYFKNFNLLVFGLDKRGQFEFYQVMLSMAKENGCDLLVTWGESGADFYHFDHDKIFHVKANKVQRVINTTGAGDAFLGSFLGMWRGNSNEIESSLKLASQVSSQVVGKLASNLAQYELFDF